MLIRRKWLCLTLIILGAFSLALFESTRIHFFDDFFPENADGYFTHWASRPTVPQLGMARISPLNGLCPFNRLINILESSSDKAPLLLHDGRELTLLSLAPPPLTPEGKPHFSRRARGPPTA